MQKIVLLLKLGQEDERARRGFEALFCYVGQVTSEQKAKIRLARSKKLTNEATHCGGVKWVAPENSPDPSVAKWIPGVRTELGQ
jgi:hypothetical protein